MRASDDGGRLDRVQAHLPCIDGCRGLAAAFVVVSHTYFQPSLGRYESWLMNHVGLHHGHFGLTVFIALSGFCLMLPVARRRDELGSVAEFVRRRARRILPPYYVALLVSAIFTLTVGGGRTGTIWDHSLPLTWQAFSKHVLLLQNWPGLTERGNVNYVLWSVALEAQLYLFFPLIVGSLRSWGRGWTLVWTVAPGVVIPIIVPSSALLTPWYLGVFAIGASCARDAVSGRVTSSARIYGLSAVTVLLALAADKAFVSNYIYCYDIAVGLVVSWGLGRVVAGRGHQHGRNRVLSWRPIVGLGMFSYSLYLIHAPLLQLSWLMLRRLGTPSHEVMFLQLVLCLPLIGGAAYLFYLAFERPFAGTLRRTARDLSEPEFSRSVVMHESR